MARTGTFGRAPRSVPSLTNTLVAIAREFQRQRDENIMDAWMQGGRFEGQKVTDKLVLDYWKARIDDVSKDDPLYDTYKNAHTQLDYTIHESKMTAKYAQMKATDQEMIRFYMNWSKKVPKNSEFYRVLMRDAGQYMRNAKAASTADSRAAEEARYQKAQERTARVKEGAGNFLITTLREIAQRGNPDLGITPLIAAPGSGSDFGNFTPDDPEAMMRLLDVIMHPTKFAAMDGERPGGKDADGVAGFEGTTDVIYHTEDGKAITGQDIWKKLKSFPGNENLRGQDLTPELVGEFIDRQLDGLNERIARAERTGHQTDANALKQDKTYFSSVKRQIVSEPIQKLYMDARATRDSVINRPGATVAECLAADAAYRATIGDLSKDERIATDDNLRSRLVGEANGDTGFPTLFESSTGLMDSDYDPSKPTETSEMNARIASLQFQQDRVQTGEAVWTYGTYDKNNIFHADPTGKDFGAATPQEVQAVSGGVVQQYGYTDVATGHTIQVSVAGTPVYARVVDPRTGEEIAASNAKPIGFEFNVTQGQKVITSYGFEVNGQMVMAEGNTPPWGVSNPDGTPRSVTHDGGATIVDFSQEFAAGITYNPNGMPKVGQFGAFKVVPKNQTGTGGVTITFDPATLAFSTDDRPEGQLDPHTDSYSLTVSTNNQTAEGQSYLINNPILRTIIENDSMVAAGFKYDINGQLVPGTGDQGMLDKIMGINFLTNQAAAAAQSRWETANDRWDKMNLPPKSSSTTTARDDDSVYSTPANLDSGKLPSDVVRNTDFGAIAKVFTEGTTGLMAGVSLASAAFTAIKPITEIKVPEYKPPVVSPIKVAGIMAKDTQQANVPGGTNQYNGGGGGSAVAGGTNPYAGTTKQKLIQEQFT